ncbi:MAG: hypothetical protein EA359_18760 [Balneolaceae bacterium]|nr:MAG: hypothetical protein EA359_18760 [Balneolaceae bacterium]
MKLIAMAESIFEEKSNQPGVWILSGQRPDIPKPGAPRPGVGRTPQTHHRQGTGQRCDRYSDDTGENLGQRPASSMISLCRLVPMKNLALMMNYLLVFD